MTAPTLAGFTPTISFSENTVNAAPQLLDGDVTFADAEGNFDGGTLSLTGLLAEDTVSVRDQGTGAGEIGLSGSDVSFGGVVIGTLSGGAGADLAITLNADATSASVDALIQNLTYANSSDTPTASRDFVLNVTDAAGEDLGRVAGDSSFAALTGAANPFAGIDVGGLSRPSFVDLDGDGDLDLVVGESVGTLVSYRNGTDTTAGAFTALTGAANPFDGFAVIPDCAPSFVDLDGDGDLDLVVGEGNGRLASYRNGTDATAGDFTALTGAANPFDGIAVGFLSTPSFVDLDADGDLDLVVGGYDGTLVSYRNGTDTTAGVFTALTGAANPFDGIDVGDLSTPSFVDLDADGDLDLVVGGINGTLFSYRNGDDTTAGVFTALTGAANPFDGIDAGVFTAPSFVDLDGDGDLDLVVGDNYGILVSFENTTPNGVALTVAVTPEDDVPTITGLPTDVVVVEGVSSDLDLSALTLADVDTTGDISLVLTASTGTLTALGGEGVIVTNTGPGAMTLTGTDSAIDAYLNDAANIQYTGDEDVIGDDAATISLTADDGSGAVSLGIVNVDITNMMIGSAVRDVLIGTSGVDIIQGFAGNDVIRGGAGADTLSGGEGVDWLQYAGSDAGVAVDLNADLGTGLQSASGGDAAGDQIQGFEYVRGSAFGDVLTGNDERNVLLGGDGNDDIAGGEGNDLIRGGAGADTLSGGEGIDWLQYIGSDAGVSVDLTVDLGTGLQNASGGDAAGDQIQGFEYVRGSNFGDVLVGNDERNVLLGGGGNDSIAGGEGNDLIRGGAGADTLSGGEGVDWLQYIGSDAGVVVGLNADPTTGLQVALGGDAQDDVISGFENIRGSDFADFLVGDAGRNLIYGGDGADTLSGFSGDDVLNGGAGTDTFMFVAALNELERPEIGGGSAARILDFNSAEDRISFFTPEILDFSLEFLPQNLVSNATGQAEATDHFLIYNTATGTLSLDFDGTGQAFEATVFADLGLGLTLTEENFV
ncbi:FG-GAP-like repeat-containing protein [Sulfitobacter sp.]|uniref:FG-GAP-like repeat-containing protein n=1 Tax=Sulfitobacter sp. TaxID=1903071 RepID=UPI003EF77CBA